LGATACQAFTGFTGAGGVVATVGAGSYGTSWELAFGLAGVVDTTGITGSAPTFVVRVGGVDYSDIQGSFGGGTNIGLSPVITNPGLPWSNLVSLDPGFSVIINSTSPAPFTGVAGFVLYTNAAPDPPPPTVSDEIRFVTAFAWADPTNPDSGVTTPSSAGITYRGVKGGLAIDLEAAVSLPAGLTDWTGVAGWSNGARLATATGCVSCGYFVDPSPASNNVGIPWGFTNSPRSALYQIAQWGIWDWDLAAAGRPRSFAAIID